MTFDRAPLWYTYSFIDSNYQTKPGYMWGSVTPATVTDWFSTTNAPSKRSYSSSAANASTITWRFQGDNFTWVFNKGVKGGIQKVTVDGQAGITPKSTVDQFNASFIYRQSITYNLKTDFNINSAGAAAWHTVVITGTGNTNSTTNPQQRFIYHDCFIDPDDLTPNAENNYDGQTVYSWDVVTPATPPSGLSGTSYASTRDNTAGLAYTFQTNGAKDADRYITWNFLTGNKGGIQSVFLDGKLIDVVDQYTASFTAGTSKTYTDKGSTSIPGVTISLAKGAWHTIFITGSGQTHSTTNPQQRFIYHDAFTLEGVLVQE